MGTELGADMMQDGGGAAEETAGYDWSGLADLMIDLRRRLCERHPLDVTDLRGSFEGDTLVLSGEVSSEDCKGDAKRLALSFDGIFKVRNDLVVAGFLEGASGSADEDSFFGFGKAEQSVGSSGGGDRRGRDGGSARAPRSLKPPAWVRREGAGVEYASVQPEGDAGPVEVTRHPAIDSDGPPQPGATIEIIVDLVMEPQPGQEPVWLGAFAGDWTSIDVSVQIAATWIETMDPASATVNITSAGLSTAARFTCRVSDEYVAGAPAVVNAYFFHGVRVCGHVLTDLTEKGRVANPSAEGQLDKAAIDVAPPPQAAAPPVKVVPGAAGPTLNVTIAQVGVDDQLWTWTALGPGRTSSGTGRVRFDESPKAFADALLTACPQLSPAEFRRRMGGVGEGIWDRSPAEFKQAYADCIQRFGSGFPIQFISDDPHVPWEMMTPVLSSVAADHLYIDHPVARWPLSRAGAMRSEFLTGTILSFVPAYASGGLPATALEGAWIEASLGARRMAPTKQALLDVLDGKHGSPVRLIHFAGHGHADTGELDGGIVLQDGVVSMTDVRQAKVTVGRTDGTLLMLNACEAAAGADLLGMSAGWGAIIAAREFGGLVAPLWAVQDANAFAMAKDMLPQLIDGSETLGSALRQARSKNANSWVASLAYLAHGDVMARFVRF
ncbi:BON domain-containing protein [Sphingomonas bacterium]|uniref:BON domain-containing protein n=1 Tax=Sphingomonas bacterium TaxID=1895847 RepID=UPI0015757BC7|nr:CHAT domain-containing protein [Sphingomonas bacterium]